MSAAPDSPRKLALITGGTGGIGFGIARFLGAQCDLALSFEKNRDRAEERSRELRTQFPCSRTETFEAPLSGMPSAAHLIKDVCDRFGRSPDIFIHCAGRLNDALFLSSEIEPHLELLNTHLIAAIALCRLLLPSMYGNRSGRIVLMSSIAAGFSKRGQTSYSAAKAGIEGFTRTLALEVAHRGITVNAVAAGLIESDLSAPIIAAHEKRDLLKKIPAGFVGQPQDIGALVAYLCSEEARYITGAVITVDGGRSLGNPLS